MHINFPPTILNNRTIIQASGKDAEKLLQDLLSCNMEHVDDEHIAWGFLLTPQGRFLNELFVIKHGDDFLLDVQSENIETFLKRLKLYTLKSEASFEQLTDWQVAAASTTVEIQGPICVPDPRLTEMGWRVYGTKSVLQSIPELSDDLSNYDAHRISLGIPAAEDFIPEKTLLLDYDVDQLGGVDFEKGCYVGQEVTARMHYRAIDKKGIYMITAAEEKGTLPSKNAPITSEGKEAGTVLTVTGNRAISMLRHEYANGTLLAEDCAIKVKRPSWIKPTS